MQNNPVVFWELASHDAEKSVSFLKTVFDWVEYVRKIEWRNPPLAGLFSAPISFSIWLSVMFYWWPLALVYRPLWYVYAILFVIGTILNISSHRG